MLNRLRLLYNHTTCYCNGNPIVTNFDYDVQPYPTSFPFLSVR